MTAVEWLDEQLQDTMYFVYGYTDGVRKVTIPLENYMRLKQEAIELEKQQIMDAFDEGQEYEYQYHINNTPKFDSQTYFTETYGSDVTSDFDKPFMDFAKQYVENLKTKNK